MSTKVLVLPFVIVSMFALAGCTSSSTSGVDFDRDTDSDGISDKNDLDIDGDGIPNVSDPDIDGDGIPNEQDPDRDGDGKGDNGDIGSPSGPVASCTTIELHPRPDTDVTSGRMTSIGWRLLSATGDQDCGVAQSGIARIYADSNAERNQSKQFNPAGSVRAVEILVPLPLDCTETVQVTYDLTDIAEIIGADPADGFTYQATHPVDQAACESLLPKFGVQNPCDFDNKSIRAATKDYLGDGSYKDGSDYASCGQIGDWNVSRVTDMRQLFAYWDYNEDIGNWNVSNVTDMREMFFSAGSFNQDLTSWCVTQFEQEPSHFSKGSNLWIEHRPLWGTCGGAGTNTDTDKDGIPNGSDPDIDGDGTPNALDRDIDGDGIWNRHDSDIDGDGIANGVDPDADGDGVLDVEDQTPGGSG